MDTVKKQNAELEDKLDSYKLPSETAKDYTWSPGSPLVFAHRKLGHVDIRKVTPGMAEKIIGAGLSHITKNAPAAASPAPAPASKPAADSK